MVARIVAVQFAAAVVVGCYLGTFAVVGNGFEPVAPAAAFVGVDSVALAAAFDDAEVAAKTIEYIKLIKYLRMIKSY